MFVCAAAAETNEILPKGYVTEDFIIKVCVDYAHTSTCSTDFSLLVRRFKPLQKPLKVTTHERAVSIKFRADFSAKNTFAA